MSDQDPKGGPKEGAPKEGGAKEPDKARGPNVHQVKNRTMMLDRSELGSAPGAGVQGGDKPAGEKPASGDAGGGKPPGAGSTAGKEAGAPTDGNRQAAQKGADGSNEERAAEGAPTPQAKPLEDNAAPVGVTGTLEAGDVWVRYFGLTDVGLVREHNEDNFLVADLAARVRGVEADKPREIKVEGLGALLAVCDGMGGAAAGEVASQMAVDTVYEVLTSWEPTKDRDAFARRLVRAIEEAGTRIFSAAKMDRTRRGMGTTSTVAGFMDKVLFIGQVGDSRAYLKRGETVTLITKDQSLVNQLIEAGQLTEEEAEAFEHSNIILQALGTTEEVQVDLTFLELRRGDRLMLCSDGLSGLVHPELIADVLRNTPDLVECAKKLVDMANAGGGHDNISVICADFDGDGLSPPSSETPALYQQYPLPPPDDGDETLPPRPMKQKVTAPKLDDVTPPTVAKLLSQANAEVGGVPGEDSAPRRWVGRIVALLLVLAIFAAVFILALVRSHEGPVVTPLRGLLGLTTGMAPVVIKSNAEGEVFVDGKARAKLTGDAEVTFMVPVGRHVFEARSGGLVVAKAEQTVSHGGAPTVVVLSLPGGDDRGVADGGAAPAGKADAAVPRAVRPTPGPAEPGPTEPASEPEVAPAPPPAVGEGAAPGRTALPPGPGGTGSPTGEAPTPPAARPPAAPAPGAGTPRSAEVPPPPPPSGP